MFDLFRHFFVTLILRALRAFAAAAFSLRLPLLAAIISTPCHGFTPEVYAACSLIDMPITLLC